MKKLPINTENQAQFHPNSVWPNKPPPENPWKSCSDSSAYGSKTMPSLKSKNESYATFSQDDVWRKKPSSSQFYSTRIRMVREIDDISNINEGSGNRKSKKVSLPFGQDNSSEKSVIEIRRLMQALTYARTPTTDAGSQSLVDFSNDENVTIDELELIKNLALAFVNTTQKIQNLERDLEVERGMRGQLEKKLRAATEQLNQAVEHQQGLTQQHELTITQILAAFQQRIDQFEDSIQRLQISSDINSWNSEMDGIFNTK